MALEWLQKHQSVEGNWDCDGFPAYCDTNPCGGIGSALHDVGITGLALLAFLGAGSSALEGEHEDCVRRGLLWLLEQQADTGFLGEALGSPSPHVAPTRRAPPRVVPWTPKKKACSVCLGTGAVQQGTASVSCITCRGSGSVDSQELRMPEPVFDPLQPRPTASAVTVYDHAIATQALCKAFALTPTPGLERPARAAVDLILKAQNPYAAWRYSIPPDGDNDTSVTAWMVHALVAAGEAGLTTDAHAFTHALTWIDQMTDLDRNSRSFGRTGYTEMGGQPIREPTSGVQFPPEYSESMTAAGVLVRILAGRTLASDPLIDAGADLLAARLPHWENSGGVSHVDFYYWYFGTLALARVGGPRWDRWVEAIRTAILDHQRTDEKRDEYGSFDPVDPWSSAGGRVYSTAILALALQAVPPETRKK
jgi:hypothetical protein